MTQAATGNRYEQEQLLTFDDIKLYTYVRYRGRPGWVLDKGDHVSRSPGRHLYIEFYDEIAEENEHMRTINVHEKLVNRRLRAREKLWVDFDHKLFSPGQ